MARSELSGPTAAINQHVAETKALLAATEGGDFERAAWMGIADHLIAIKRLEPTWGDERIGKLFGKSKRWTQDVVRWRTNGGDRATPFAGQAGTASDPAPSTARRVLREQPETLIPEIAEALEDPAVARALADKIAGTDAGHTIGALDRIVSVAKADKEYQDAGEPEPPRKERERTHLYRTILDRTSNIYLQVRYIARALRDFNGTHDERELERSAAYLQAAEELIHQIHEELLEAGSIDMDAIMEEIQAHLERV